METSLLRQGNVTWRFPYRHLEYVRPMDEYLGPSGRIILEDFEHTARSLRSLREKHDELADGLRVAAAAAFDALLNRSEFQEAVRSKLGEYMARRTETEYPGGTFSRDDFPKLVAEHVVNSVREIAPHHTDSEFWKRYGAEFLRLGSGPAFEELRGASEKLLEHDEKLAKWLRDKRRELSVQFDIPPAPVATLVSRDV